ncbi:hypothetical protein FAES_1684 [Fibrella aestuarina BUZ 2]|uniref:Uncharacterized protein n=1 Tax=Fibrella aestuarina BUZ 2 TaxID=1166018 RepID=I0K6E1_9BACT|nr:hypothetical protein [Fibrella aestuarina]CCG99694.1 hypothetical protein FAES_1684 [Fibrella aestuarina BUZ 2]
MKTLLSCSLVLLMASHSYAQPKTSAFFMIGNYASPNWEKLAFDLTNGAKTMTYSYAANERGHTLQKLGTRMINGQKGVVVKIPGTAKTYVIVPNRAGKQLLMMSEDGTYRKRFPLGYEGPVDGRGTFCATCANEPKDAFALVDSFVR